MTEGRRRGVFLDRDGTINRDRGFVHRPEDFEFVPKAAESIRRLNRKGFAVVVVTNQSGVGRGLYTEEDVENLHRYVNARLREEGARIDRFYFCPHHPGATLLEYRRRCACRKPEPGMILRAMRELDIGAEGSYLIGDMIRDIQAGNRAGVKTILIAEGESESGAPDSRPDYRVSSLAEAVSCLLAEG
jgi:D-glycero-D-manno-heptose 1,7-bisphosphate phosphatase